MASTQEGADASMEDILALYRQKRKARQDGPGEGGQQDDGETPHGGSLADAERDTAGAAIPTGMHSDSLVAATAVRSGSAEPSATAKDTAAGDNAPAKPTSTAAIEDGSEASGYGSAKPDGAQSPEVGAGEDNPLASTTTENGAGSDNAPLASQDEWEPVDDDVPVDPAMEMEDDAPTGMHLSRITHDALQLREHAEADKLLTNRGSPMGRGFGIAIILVGIVMVLFEYRWAQVYGVGFVVTEALVHVWQVGLLFGTFGAILWLAFFFAPPRRKLGIKLPDDQASAWKSARGALKALHVVQGIGWFFVGLCALVAGYGVVYPAAADAIYYVALAAIVGLVGLAMILVVAVRRGPLRKLLAQTMLIAALEKASVTVGDPAPQGEDPRFGPVLRRLDQLLGTLPDAAVSDFLASPEAQLYLQLMETYAGDKHGG